MIPNIDRRFRREGFNFSVLTWLSAGALAAQVSAQVVLDGKFGTAGPISGSAISIPAEVGAVRGNNLFHSFQQFDLKAGDVATFTGPANIQSILSRVTGGAPSSIDGTIRSQITGANFFLINPSGLIFGPNAKVDVSGSFAVSSANYLKLADGARFVASLDADDSALTTAPVSAFGFLDGNAGNISLQGSGIQGRAGTTISVVGGDVTVEGGFLRSSGGDINVASVKSAGESPVNLASITGPEFKSAFPSQGQISVRGHARLDVSGRGGGRVVIRGGSLQVDNARIESNTTGNLSGRGIDIATSGDIDVSNNGQVNSVSTLGSGAGGNISIIAEDLRLDGGGVTDPFFNPTTQISTGTGGMFSGGGPAKGGDISIKARNVELVNSAQISAASFGAGDAGRIDIEASTVALDAKLVIAQITVNSQLIQGGGKAGDIHIKADALTLENAATILATSFGSGAAGIIDIEANSIAMRNGGTVAAAAFGSGDGGNVRVQAQSIFINGDDPAAEEDSLTGIQAVTTSLSDPAPGGNIAIDADTIVLEHAGSIFTRSIGAGKGGDISIEARDLTLGSGSSITASGEGAGPAGNIDVRTDGGVLLSGESHISTFAPGSSGGDIEVASGSEIRLFDKSQINAQAGLDGGNITVSAPSLIYLLNSRFTGQADTTGSGFGNGGNLTIGPSAFLILNESELISKASFGNGGNITILADNFFQSESLIDASAPFGLPGTVEVTAPDVDLSGSLIGLSGNLLDAESQLRPDCGIRLMGDFSSFIVLGRGGLPLQPGGFLPSGMVPRNE